MRWLTRVTRGIIVPGAVALLTAACSVTASASVSDQASSGLAASWQLAGGLPTPAQESGPTLRESLVIPGIQWLVGSQQLALAKLASRESPQAFVTRLRSQTEFDHLDTARAAHLALEAFPSVGQRSWGTPALPTGAHIAGYISTRAARVSLAGGRHVLLESLGPIADETSPRHFSQIDLGLKASSGGYVPTASVVAVRLPSRLSRGFSLPGAGVSVLPVDVRGRPLDSSGAELHAASVLYGNAQTDADTLAQPTISGVELGTMLRSIASPQTLYYRLSAPGGVRLVHKKDGSLAVLSRGVVAARVLAPHAVDASGEVVPVRMSAVGDLLVIGVEDRQKDLQWPVRVDPEVIDEAVSGYCDKGVYTNSCKELAAPEGPSNWKFFHSTQGAVFALTSCNCEGNGSLRWYPATGWVRGNNAGVLYETQGESHIFGLGFAMSGSYSGNASVELAILSHESKATEVNWRLEHPENQEGEFCIGARCETSQGTSGNVARIITIATAPSGGPEAFSTELKKARVFLYQANPPEVGFNTTSSQIATAGNRPNVLYGGETWLGPYSGAFEITAHDPGIGVSGIYARRTTYSVGARRFYFRGECSGVQCQQTNQLALTYNTNMLDGEWEVEAEAEDEMAQNHPVAKHVLKVDATPPHNVAVTGWPSNREISAASHSVTIEASDGEKPKKAGETELKSSGVKSIAVKIDGGPPTTLPGASCPLGPCTASGKYTIAAEGLTEGVHRLVVTALDNANNPAAKQFTFDVRHAKPLSVGPGAVDPTTGEFQLGATDVSLGGITGVSRVYRSRNLTAGIDGPLGPQWALSLGGSEKLTVLPDGSVALSAATGGRTTFTRNPEDKFESPLGDGNLSLEAKEATQGQGITEYVVKDTTAGSTTHFAQPSGMEKTPPLLANQFGGEGAQLNGPSGIASDAAGNVWVADSMDGRIMKFSPAGVLLGAYGQENEAGRLLNPQAIAINQSTGLVYVADEGHHRIVVRNAAGEFQETFGIGVKNGAQEFQICKSECQTGLTGAAPANGEFRSPQGLAVDSGGNVWVSDASADRIQEFNANGEFLQAFGQEGTGEGQFKTPVGLAFSQGRLYVSEAGNDRVQQLSTAGKFEGKFGKEGIGNAEFKEPEGIAVDPRSANLYVTDKGNSRVQEFTPAGELIAKFGTASSGSEQLATPVGVAASNSGLFVTDYGANRVDEWMRSSWLPTVSEGTLSSGRSTRSYTAVEVEPARTEIFPSEVPAPAPVGVSCGSKPEELKVGCRDLLFKYAEKGEKSATGEGPSEWGSYPGRLMRVSLVAYNPAGSPPGMEEKAVAEYAYDAQGRLRAEWDPRIAPHLKTRYGYDSVGHVVAVSRAGREPWLLQYGALDGDPDTGRLLSVTRPAPATVSVVEEQAGMAAPEDEEAPKLSSASPEVGVTLSATRGKWHNTPLAYTYQWQDCTSATECKPSMGAVNETYTPQSGDVGYKLAVIVTAENADGARAATSSLSATVPSEPSKPGNPAPAPPNVGSATVYTLAYRVPLSGSGLPTMSKEELAQWGQTHDLPAEAEATAVFPPDTPMGWPARSYERATITYFDEQGRAVNARSPMGGISTSEYNGENEIVRTLSAQNRATALQLGSTIEARAKIAGQLDTQSTYANGELVETLGPEHKVKLAHGKQPGEEVEARAHVVYSYDENGPPGLGLVTKVEDAAKTASGEELDKRTTVTSYGGQTGLGWTLRKPTSVTVNAGASTLTTTTRYDRETGNVVETIPPGSPRSPLPIQGKTFGKSGSGAGEMSKPTGTGVDVEGNVWVTDVGNNRIDEFTAQGAFIKAFGWGVSKGEAKLEVCTSATGCKAGLTVKGKESLANLQAITYDAEAGALFISDSGRNQIIEFTTEGVWLKSYPNTTTLKFKSPAGLTAEANGDVWIASPGTHSLVEMSDRGKYIKTAGLGKGEFSDVTICRGKLYAADRAGELIDEVGTESRETILKSFGGPGKESGQFSQLARIACNPQNGDIYATDSSASRVEVFTGSGAFVGTFGVPGPSPGEMEKPLGISVAPFSLTTYVANSGHDRVLTWEPNETGPGAHGARTAYYSAGAESPVPACRNHPEWSDLPCQVEPIVQPQTPGLPALPVTSYTYNIWDEVEATIESFPANGALKAVTRKKLQSYDSAGRAKTSETLAEPATDTALTAVADTYNSSNGTLEAQSAGEHKITSLYNTIGQLETYTDAGASTTTYHYEPGGDVRLTGIEDSKGTQGYSYNATSGRLETLTDSAAGVFTAGYDIEGQISEEVYPDGLHGIYSYNSLGKATSLEYRKLSNCAHTCPETWLSDKIDSSIHGEAMEQTSTLATETYTYDEAGRLLETQETPSSKGCTTRLYGYDEESNRISLTTRKSSTATCATEGGTSEAHKYDLANRLEDPGVAYEELGNTTKLSAADAGGHELTTSYYVDGQVASQTQNEQTLEYRYDPSGRAETTISKGKVATTTVSHYAGGGEAVTWVAEVAGAWTRDIPGIDGSLSATATSSGQVTLLLHDLRGNVVATAAKGEAETKLQTTYNSTEFGVPSEGKTPPKYAWLGAGGVTSEPAFESGIATKGGASYVPQIARSLQTVQIAPPGACPDGCGSASPYDASIGAGNLASAEAQARQTAAEAEAAEQAALRRKAEEEAASAAPPGEVPSVEGVEVESIEQEAVEEGEETDPSASGVWGHLHVNYKVLRCDQQGCEGHFTYNGVITDRGTRESTLRASIRVDNPGWPQSEPYEEHAPVYNYSSTPTYIEDIFIPFGTTYKFYLYVRVGKHRETLELAFTSVKGEILY
jgi:sugar lactone lactonase YvrE